MKIYLAATAPGHDQKKPNGFLLTPYRLISYFLIIHKKLESDIIFNNIIKFNKNESKKK